MPAPDPSLRHVPKLAEQPSDSEPIYRCQLCRRQGTRDQLLNEECTGRSGVQRRVLLEAGESDRGVRGR